MKKCEPPLKRKQIKDVGREGEKRRTHNNWKTQSKMTMYLLTVINMIWLNPFIKDRGFQIR